VGMLHGNLKELLDGDTDAIKGMMFLFDGIIPLMGGLCVYFFLGEKSAFDRKSGWNKYYFSLPPSDKERIIANYSIAVIMTIVSFVLCIIFSVVCHAVFGDLELSVLKMPVMVFSMSSALAFILVAVNYILKDKKKMAAFSFSMYFVTMGGFVIWLRLTPSEEEMTAELEKLLKSGMNFYSKYYWIIPVVYVVVAALSCYVSYIALKKGRESLC